MAHAPHLLCAASCVHVRSMHAACVCSWVCGSVMAEEYGERVVESGKVSFFCTIYALADSAAGSAWDSGAENLR